MKGRWVVRGAAARDAGESSLVIVNIRGYPGWLAFFASGGFEELAGRVGIANHPERTVGVAVAGRHQVPFLVVFCFDPLGPLGELLALRSRHPRVGGLLNADLYRTAQTGSDSVGRGFLSRGLGFGILPNAEQGCQGEQNDRAAEVHTDSLPVFKQVKNNTAFGSQRLVPGYFSAVPNGTGPVWF
jgi:hypothetical protein